MNQKTWTAVDEYLNLRLIASDPALEAALDENARAGLPAFDVAPNQGKLLHLLARMSGARRILEIGTLGGYSTIWLARALPPGGKLVSLESDPNHAEVARGNIRNAKLERMVEIRLGAALDSLEHLEAERALPFDFVFIDADKPNNPTYLEWSMKLSRPGTVIIADNVVRDGAIVDPGNTDPRVQGVQKFFDKLSTDGRLAATAIQTVGSKGYDGFALALVNS